MKIVTLLFLATSLIFAANFNASQEPPELQEATTLNDSVIKLVNEQKFDQALPLAKRALEIRERLLPANDIRISLSLSNLGKLYVAKKDYKAARDVFQRLLTMQEQQFGPENLRLLDTLDWLAMLHYQTGDSAAAEATYNRTLALREKGFGPKSVQVGHTLYALGEFYRTKGDVEQAAVNYRRALNIFGENSNSLSADYERTSEGFVCLAYERNKPEIFKEIEQIRKRFDPYLYHPLEVLNGKALSLPRPDYPDEARIRHLSGNVVVKVEINETGGVINAVDMCGGPPYLSQSSVAAARKARFSPTLLHGVPVKVNGIIQYRFVHQ